MSTLSYLEPPKFLGKSQPAKARVPGKPMVQYEKGGSDFRVVNKSSIELKNSTTIGNTQRFGSSETIGPGPFLGQQSSLNKQVNSHRKTAGTSNFGTSTRDSALKMYTVYTAKKG